MPISGRRVDHLPLGEGVDVAGEHLQLGRGPLAEIARRIDAHRHLPGVARLLRLALFLVDEAELVVGGLVRRVERGRALELLDRLVEVAALVGVDAEGQRRLLDVRRPLPGLARVALLAHLGRGVGDPEQVLRLLEIGVLADGALERDHRALRVPHGQQALAVDEVLGGVAVLEHRHQLLGVPLLLGVGAPLGAQLLGQLEPARLRLGVAGVGEPLERVEERQARVDVGRRPREELVVGRDGAGVVARLQRQVAELLQGRQAGRPAGARQRRQHLLGLGAAAGLRQAMRQPHLDHRVLRLQRQRLPVGLDRLVAAIGHRPRIPAGRLLLRLLLRAGLFRRRRRRRQRRHDHERDAQPQPHAASTFRAWGPLPRRGPRAVHHTRVWPGSSGRRIGRCAMPSSS